MPKEFRSSGPQTGPTNSRIKVIEVEEEGDHRHHNEVLGCSFSLQKAEGRRQKSAILSVVFILSRLDQKMAVR